MGRVSFVCVAIALLSCLVTASATAAPGGFTVIGVESPGGTATISSESLLSGGHKIGHDRTVCALGRVTTCQTTFFVPKGTIRTRSHPATSAAVFTLRLSGGTGIYKGVGGTVTVRSITRGQERETFKFT